MGQDPKEAWRKLQQTLAQAQQRGGGFGGSPRGFLGGAAGLLLLGGGTVLAMNSIFNGKTIPYCYHPNTY